MSESRLTQPRTLIAATAAVATLLTAGSILGGQAIRRRLRTAELKRQVEADLAGQPWADTTARGAAGEEIAGGGDVTPERGFVEAGMGPEKVWEKGEYDEELIREQVRPFSPRYAIRVVSPIADLHNTNQTPGSQLSRNYTFLGEQGMQKVRNSYVVVVRPSPPKSHPGV